MSTPIADSDYAWLRSSPTDLPRETPGSFRAMVMAKDQRWNQLYMEWLAGATSGTKNADQVLAEFNGAGGGVDGEGAAVDQDVLTRWFTSLAADPGKKTTFEPWDIAPDVKIPKFEKSYPRFAGEVAAIRAAAEARVRQLQENARKDGTKLSTKDARKKAGRETQRLAMANAAESQGRTMDVNTGLVLQMQIERYKVTGLEMYLNALNQIEEVPWDTAATQGTADADEADAGGDKAQALAVMRAAGTTVLNAAARLKNATTLIAAMKPGEKVTPVHEAAMDDMFEALLDFSDAIAAQGRAIATAGGLVQKWARRATRTNLKENFNTVYPGLGAALLTLRSAVAITVAVLDFFPPFDLIGPVLEFGDEAVEAAIKELVVWHDSQSKEVQADYIGQEFVVDREHLSSAGKAFVTANKLNEGIGWVEDNTIGRLGDGLKAGGKKVAELVAKGVGLDESLQKDARRGADKVGSFVFDHREDLVEKVIKKEIPLGVASITQKIVEAGLKKGGKTSARAVPFVGAAFTVGSVVLDGIEFGADQYKVLRTRAGLTEEDVHSLRAIIVDGVGNPLQSMFQSGEIVVEAKAEGADHLYVRVSGFRMRVVLGANPRIDNADERLVLKAIVAEVRLLAPEGLQFQGRQYRLQWASAALAAYRNPVYKLTMPATVTIGERDFEVEADVEYDNQAQFARVVAVRGDGLPADDVLAKLGEHKKPMGFEQFTPEHEGEITVKPADIQRRFAGQEVSFAGDVFILSAGVMPSNVLMDTRAGAVFFSMRGRRKTDNRTADLQVSYGLDGEVDVLFADIRPDPMNAEKLKKTPPTVDDVVSRFQGVRVEFEWSGGTNRYELGEECRTVVADRATGALTFTMVSTESHRLDLRYAGGVLEVQAVTPDPVTEAKEKRRAQLTAAGSTRINLREAKTVLKNRGVR